MSTDSSEIVLEDGLTEASGDGASGSGEPDYLRLSENAYKSSTDYMRSNLQRQWERNLSNFLSRHPQGSKYRTDAYRFRSRLFRPKTRSTVRSKEAAMVLALFSTSDFAVLKASDVSDATAVASASVLKEIIALRLKQSIPWYKTVIGGTQDAEVMGSVISHQYWDYEEEPGEVDESKTELVYDAETGAEIPRVVEPEPVVIKDTPVIELVENENFRIDPGANWVDPVNTSPYTIQLIPMYIVDVLDRMKRVDNKTGQPEWKPMSMAEIVSANSTRDDTDSTRLAREGVRQDPKSDQFTDNKEHQIVWVHRNIMRMPGKGDMIWYTLGTKRLLSDPIPLREAYPHLPRGRRPYAIGHAIIEAHRNHPSSVVELGQDMQAATNDNLNQRFDNVRQVLNKRYFVRRGSTVDLRSLRRNVPGSITMMGDPEKDVKQHETNDVTSSSYQEQNLFNLDFDEVTGQFSASSTGANKELGETVGGMRMLKDPSNVMTEYIIRTICETWLKEVLTQLVWLEQEYETDEVIIKAAGKNAKIDNIPRNMMDKSLDVSVDVGFGVTDPQARVGKLLYGIESAGKVVPRAIGRLKEDQILSEIFGILGYQDGSRFFMNDEELAEYQQANPAQPGEVQLKIQSQERIESAKLELQRIIAEATILSDERKKAAELNVQVGGKLEERNLKLGERDIQLSDQYLKKLDIDVKREAIKQKEQESLRKDAEIKDKEVAKKRSGGSE